MKIVEFEQRSPEWLRWRGEGIGASEVAALLNGSCLVLPYWAEHDGDREGEVVITGTPYGTPYRLWAVKTGVVQPEDLSSNPHVQRGIAQEDEARVAANARFKELGLSACAEDDDHPFIRVSFDALFSDGTPLEVKAPSDSVFERCKAEGPLGYQVPQVLDQMLVAGAKVGRQYLHKRGEEPLIFRFGGPEAEEAMALLRLRQVAFWERVRSFDPPPLDPSMDVLNCGEDGLWVAAAGDWLKAKAGCDAAKEVLAAADAARKEAEGRLAAELAGFAVGEGAGVRVTQFIRQGAVDYKAVLAEFAPNVEADTLAGYRGNPSQQLRVTAK